MIQALRVLDNDKTIFDKDTHYIIPRYQRAYAWEDKEIVQLIDDINDSQGNYYIGSLVVAKSKTPQEVYEVIDGQQRLTTLYLLLNYLVSSDGLKSEVEQSLSFDCRPNSNYTLTHIQALLPDKRGITEDEDRLEQSILNGIKAIHQKFTTGQGINIAKFIKRLPHIVLYRIEVPQHTDLNRYFEIMNTRGEQLEQHDILKAQLMGYLRDKEDRDFFARVWEACSDMTGYVQMHFAPTERNEIFGGSWNSEPADSWSHYKTCLSMGQKDAPEIAITEIIGHDFKIQEIDGTLEDNTPIRFESIINFPYFLLHVLRAFIQRHQISLPKNLGSLLDDKKLIQDFSSVISNGIMRNRPIEGIKEEFAKNFIVFLLRARYLFDKFIIKREYAGDDQEGSWSLKELFTSGKDSKKRAYYANTKLKYENEWEKTYTPRNKDCLMIQSALRVSYTSPKVMHWVTNLLVWLFDNYDKPPMLLNEAESIAAQATQEGFLDQEENYALGTKTPHIVFNYLDYLLWRKDKDKYSDFSFEFRNSVEHWYPQHPSEGSFESWGDKDRFGNLCLISRSVNSKFSNLSPESKMKSYKKMVEKGSLKLRIMGDFIERSKISNEDWRNQVCKEHEEEMIKILKAATDKIAL